MEPENLFSRGGKLEVNLTYQTYPDASGHALFCFVADNGSQSPTLHVRPGDELVINVKNAVPAAAGPSGITAPPRMIVSSSSSNQCQTGAMDSTSMNIHYHGTNLAPVCHQDEIVQTVIDAGQSYRYDLHFPNDEPPGLYWYHPHVHGMAEAAVLGGASGAIVVEGIADVNPIVAGLPERVLILREQPGAGGP